MPRPVADAYNLGWHDARETGDSQAEADADRLYRALCAALAGERPAVPAQTLAQLERIRGNPARADRIEADLRQRFGDTAA